MVPLNGLPRNEKTGYVHRVKALTLLLHDLCRRHYCSKFVVSGKQLELRTFGIYGITFYDTKVYHSVLKGKD